MMASAHTSLSGTTPRLPVTHPDGGGPGRDLTRILLLAGGAHGTLLALPSGSEPGQIQLVLHHCGTHSRRQADHHDTTLVATALRHGLLRLARPDGASTAAALPLLAPLHLTDAGRGWLIAHRAHGVAITLRAHPLPPADGAAV